MNQIVTLALKDLALLRRDKMGLFWIFIFPLVYALFFGALTGGSGQRGMGAIAVAVVDEDDSAGSKAFLARLEKSPALRITRADRDEARQAVRRGRLAGYIVIPKGYGERAEAFRPDGPPLEVGIDPARRAEAGYLEGLLTEATFAGLQETFSDPKKMKAQINKALADVAKMPEGEVALPLRRFLGELDQFVGKVDGQALANSPFAGPARIKAVPVTPQVEGQPRSAYEITFPSAILWGLIGCIMTFAISLVVERTHGTLLRLRLAPLSWGRILAGKGLACYVTAVLVAGLILLIGSVGMGVRLSNPIGLVLAVGCLAFCFMGLMMLLSTIGKSERAVAGSGWGLMMPFVMIGGGMIPLAFMPAWMQGVSNISPVKWGILALEGAIWRDFTLTEMLLPCAILLAVGAAAFLVGVKLLGRQEA
jgi:ABC-2 type transport system permease protein